MKTKSRKTGRRASKRGRASDALVAAPRKARVQPKAAPSIDELEPGAADVRQRLLRHGASHQLSGHVVKAVLESGQRGAFAIDAAARIIGELFRIDRPSKRGTRPYVLTFIGPTGSGKTTTLAKLGRRLREAGREVAFISLDPVGASALERVGGTEADVDRLEIPLMAARSAKDVRHAAAKHAGADLLLLDTPGMSPRDEAAIEALGEELSRVDRHLPGDTYMVLPANVSPSALALGASALRPLGPRACVLTKLDETAQPAGALELTLRSRLPVAFLCDGQDTRAHLARPKPGHFADLLLRGRIA
jgi:flagellar biosynthesis GTPase FlhF